MPNPLDFLSPTIEVLGGGLEGLLPAVANAVEDLQRPDVEEIEDWLINRDTKEVTAFAETPEPTIQDIYRPTPPLYRYERHHFRYFIDGSLRTYFLGTGIEAGRTFPILLAQIGAAVIHRKDDGRVSVLDRKTRILLLLPGPTGGQGVSDSLWQQLQRCSPGEAIFEVVDTTRKTPLTPREAHQDDPRNRAGGIARHRMHQLEIELIESTDGLRGDRSWLIIDGAVKLAEFISSPFMIGVAKSFRKDPVFQFCSGRKTNRRDITSILAGLPYAHRTAAFSASDGQVAFWYVRLREQKELDYPLMGVVKVELPCPDRQPVDTELADLISRALVGERNATPYAKDRRWHCHLYPIYIAEQVIKNAFFSREVIMAAIRWPSSTRQGG